VKEDLLEKTGLNENRIEHIGSTAIKKMAAKPIIDILVGIDHLEKADKALFRMFYEVGFLRLRVERPNEIVLARFTDETYEEKTHYIHLVEYETELWRDLIFFRDFLNESVEARKRYVEIKRDYIKEASTGIKEYTDRKEAFVKEIISQRERN
jgi:GrpB-like predicted nucleotidyltransferase (UPF0157 family)